MKKWMYVPILSIIAGEFLIFDDKVLPGLYIHFANLLVIVLLIIFGNLSLGTINISQSLILFILLRIINVSMPIFFTNIHLQYLLIYGVMLIPIYSIIKNQQMSYKELRVNFISIVILMGIVIMMIVQYANIVPYIRSEDIYGKLMSILLIIYLSILLLVKDTEYWNKHVSNTLGICCGPLLLTFMTIVIFKVKTII